MPRDPKAAVLRVGVYVFLYVITVMLTARMLVWLGGDFLGLTLSIFLGAGLTNYLAMRIYERRPLLEIGLQWNSASARNLFLGMAGGAGTATLVLCAPLAGGLARFRPEPEAPATWGTFLFGTALLLAGAAGEEMLFRGYGFQVLLATWGPYATVLPVGVVFAALHSANPNATYLGLANTAGFGVLFGYAYLRSRDLWLPIGLHFGWNLVLPLFGVNVSGITIRLTGYAMEWTSAADWWSGGKYGPEGSVLTTAALAGLFLYLRKAPVRSQTAPLLEAP